MSLDYANAEDTGNETSAVDGRFSLPKKAYKVRCTDCVFKRSKVKIIDGVESGNHPMLERTWEIIAPEKVKVRIPNTDEFEEKVCAGIEVKDWLVMTTKSKVFVKQDSERLGVEMPDDETPNMKQYIGKEMSVILKSNVITQMDEETGEPILNSKGEKVISFQHQMGEKL